MEPLLAPDWYRVADLRLRLREGVRVSPQQVRDETWYLLTDPLSGRHHRFNDIAYELIKACNGERTLNEVWEQCAAATNVDALTQGEAVRVIAQAFAANLLVGNVAPDAQAIVKAQQRDQRQRTRAAVNPLSFKVPLWDADTFLSAHIDRWRWLFTPAVATTVLTLVVLSALLLAAHASDYTAFARTHLSNGRMLLILWLTYPLVKALHEGAHAMAVKAFGGEVHEIGVTLLMLTPVPYVDASASIGFASKRQRVAVAGAGIAVELVLASVALCLWLALEPGLLKEAAFAVVLICGVSTLAINGNPLLRFDGYHMLCDQFELPNLARRSQQYWSHCIKRGVLRVQSSRFNGHARGALPWLLAYAPLSWLYRAFLLAVLSVWLVSHSSLLGLAALALALWLCLLQPAFSALRYVARSPELHGQRVQAAFMSLVCTTTLGALLFAVELPNYTRAPGVVWLQDDALVRLGTDGFVEQFMASDGDQVAAGQPLLRLSNDELQLQLQRVQSQLVRLEVERAAVLMPTPCARVWLVMHVRSCWPSSNAYSSV
jgi:putative peptide zinc metalloprotease protein